MKSFLYALGVAAIFSSCSKQKADVIVYNAKVYTVNSSFDTAEALAVKDGKILAVGTSDEIRKQFEGTEEINAVGKSVYPGFIDAHAHFYGYGQSLQTADLRETK